MMTLAQMHDAFRDLVEAGESAGWDCTENKDVLNRARDAFADFVTFYSGEVASEEPLDPGQRGPCPGHEWAYTGTAYGGDDPSYHGEGRCYCVHCGADGDA